MFFFLWGGGAQEWEEIGFLLFKPNLSDKFVDETQTYTQLDTLARDLIGRNLANKQIHVYGYTAIVQNDIDSLQLSKDRSIFIIQELIKRGISPELFSEPVGYGAIDKWGNNSNEDFRRPNRRVIVLLENIIVPNAVVDTPEQRIITESIQEPIIINENTDKSIFKFPWFILLIILLVILIIVVVMLIIRNSGKGVIEDFSRFSGVSSKNNTFIPNGSVSEKGIKKNPDDIVSEKALNELGIDRKRFDDILKSKVRYPSKESGGEFITDTNGNQVYKPSLSEPTKFKYESEKNGGKEPGTWKQRAEGNRDFLRSKDAHILPQSDRDRVAENYDALSKGGGILYKSNGYPDFAPLAYAEINIETIEQNRIAEYRYPATNKNKDRLSMNEEGDMALDKKNGWEPGTAKKFRESNDLTWHESEDLKTQYLVPQDIHESLPHTGGHAIIKEILGRGD